MERVHVIDQKSHSQPPPKRKASTYSLFDYRLPVSTVRSLGQFQAFGTMLRHSYTGRRIGKVKTRFLKEAGTGLKWEVLRFCGCDLKCWKHLLEIYIEIVLVAKTLWIWRLPFQWNMNQTRKKSHILPRGTAVSGRLTTANTRTEVPICPMKFSFFVILLFFPSPPVWNSTAV